VGKAIALAIVRCEIGRQWGSTSSLRSYARRFGIKPVRDIFVNILAGNGRRAQLCQETIEVRGIIACNERVEISAVPGDEAMFEISPHRYRHLPQCDLAPVHRSENFLCLGANIGLAEETGLEAMILLQLATHVLSVVVRLELFDEYKQTIEPRVFAMVQKLVCVLPCV